MAEGVRAISTNTSSHGGMALNVKLSELFEERTPKKEKTAEEVIRDISDGLDRLGKT